MKKQRKDYEKAMEAVDQLTRQIETAMLVRKLSEQECNADLSGLCDLCVVCARKIIKF